MNDEAQLAKALERLGEVKAERDALAAHVMRLRDDLIAACDRDSTGYPASVDELPSHSLDRRDADTASSVHKALIEGAERNNLRKAPNAEQAIDFILSIARVEAEKRRPMQLQASQADKAGEAS